MLPAQGGCQCGACRYVLTATPYVAYACHCGECRKLTASAFLLCLQVPAEGVVVVAGEPACRERTGESGNRVAVRFCAQCGSTLFAVNSSRPRVLTVHIGSLDAPEQVPVENHIWVSRKLPWVVIPPHHRQFERAGDWRTEYRADPGRYAGG